MVDEGHGIEGEEPGRARSELLRAGREQGEGPFFREMVEHRAGGQRLDQRARAPDRERVESDEVRVVPTAGPLQRQDGPRAGAIREDLTVLPLERPVPHDRVPDGIVFEERADGLSILDSHGRRGGANGVAGKKG
jgi:hypothetical protein